MIALVIIIALVLVVGVYAITTYNGLVAGRNKVEEAFSTMDVFLKKRNGMIPKIVVTVKAYAKHEAETLEKVVAARNETAPLAQRIDQEKQVSAAMRNLMVRLEAYPELKASTNFLQLQQQLTGIEGEIESSRRYYNGSVRQQNDRVQQFPSNVVAGMFHFEKMPLFQAEEYERRNVDVAGMFNQ